MPIYLVRWPTLSASLVRARNEEDLIDTLDQVADPGGCTYKVYKGPLWIDLDLPFEVSDSDQAETVQDFNIVPSSDFGDHESYLVVRKPTDCDAVSEMREQVLKWAFPAVAEYLDEADLDDPNVSEDLLEAVSKDLLPLLQYKWRQKGLEKRDDPLASWMQQMGVTKVVPSMVSMLLGFLKTLSDEELLLAHSNFQSNTSYPEASKKVFLDKMAEEIAARGLEAQG